MSKTVEAEWVPTVHFTFEGRNKKGASVPKNFDDLDVDKEISVTVDGKVDMIRHDQDGKSFSMTIKKVKLVFPDEKPMGVADAMYEAQKKRQA